MQTRKTIAVVAVRMGSSRLPGKVLMPVAGKPVLGHLLDRLSLARNLDGVVVATSVRPENDPVEAYCTERGVPVFRGSEEDVLGRLAGALQSQEATVGVVVYGDCPLIDPAIVDMIVDRFHAEAPKFDFVGNDLTTSWPPGMEVEALSMKTLNDAAANCDDKAMREHGTLFVRLNPDRYRLLNVEAPEHFHAPGLALEIDAQEDVEVAQALLSHFAGRPSYGLGDVFDYIGSRPELAKLNAGVHRRWKQYRQDSNKSAD